MYIGQVSQRRSVSISAPATVSDDMMKEKDVAYVLERMRAMCSRREYCVADILKKTVTALDGDKEAAQKIVDRLVADRYLDDRRFASAYARDKASISGWGTAKIRYMLAAKGVACDVISEALGEIDSERAGVRLETLRENKYRSLKDDPQCRMKLLRFALGRGYSYDDVMPVIDKFLKNL